MIELKQWMQIVKYRITEGSEYGWNCFGSYAYMIDSWDGNNTTGHSLSIVFDTRTQTVYQVEAHDYQNFRAYSYTNPDFKSVYEAEIKERGSIDYDGYTITELDDLDDWITKATSIVDGEDYDTRVVVPLNFSKDELYEIMKLAHEMDMSLNKFVEHVLALAIKKAQL